MWVCWIGAGLQFLQLPLCIIKEFRDRGGLRYCLPVLQCMDRVAENRKRECVLPLFVLQNLRLKTVSCLSEVLWEDIHLSLQSHFNLGLVYSYFYLLKLPCYVWLPINIWCCYNLVELLGKFLSSINMFQVLGSTLIGQGGLVFKGIDERTIYLKSAVCKNTLSSKEKWIFLFHKHFQ